MTRSEVISTVLVNSGISYSRLDAELLIRKTFEDEIADRDYDSWNSNIDLHIAQTLIDSIGINHNINLRMFILDLEKF